MQLVTLVGMGVSLKHAAGNLGGHGGSSKHAAGYLGGHGRQLEVEGAD